MGDHKFDKIPKAFNSIKTLKLQHGPKNQYLGLNFFLIKLTD